MRLFTKILPVKADCPRLAVWVFFIAWLIGAAALAGGLEGLRGFVENTLAACILAVACVAWWGAYEMSEFRATGSFIVIALWMSVPSPLFWIFVTTFRIPFFGPQRQCF
jgi:hypothetical protein